MIDTSIIESPRRDTSPQVYAGLPAQAYVPNPYDFGRPAIVYPGDSVYYSAPEPHDKARAADTVLERRAPHSLRLHEPGLARKPRTGGGNGSGYSIWVERPPRKSGELYRRR